MKNLDKALITSLNNSPLPPASIVFQLSTRIGLIDLHSSIAIGIPKVFAISIVTPYVALIPGVSHILIFQGPN